MPWTRIETRKGWIGDRRREVIEAVQRALIAGLKVPEDDRCIALVEHDRDAMIVPPGKGASYLVIEIKLFAGRSADAKRRLYKAIVDELAGFDVLAADIKTILIESEPLNWSLRGVPVSDLDLGFKIDV